MHIIVTGFSPATPFIWMNSVSTRFLEIFSLLESLRFFGFRSPQRSLESRGGPYLCTYKAPMTFFFKICQISDYPPPTQPRRIPSLWRHPRDWGDPSPLFRASPRAPTANVSSLSKFCFFSTPHPVSPDPATMTSSAGLGGLLSFIRSFCSAVLGPPPPTSKFCVNYILVKFQALTNPALTNTNLYSTRHPSTRLGTLLDSCFLFLFDFPWKFSWL